MKNIKDISIKKFLAERGITPVRENSCSGFYLSPIREEKTASFKVDYNKNLWIDFGINKGGSIIDLVMRLECCSIAEAMKKLEDGSGFSYHTESSTRNTPTRSAMRVEYVQLLENRDLLDYLSLRGIDLDIAKYYCREVHYKANNKHYFAIGFPSDKGGWELRNQYFKGCISPKGITSFISNNRECLLFEGFVNMLSYLTLKRVQRPPVDIVVLNSVIYIDKAVELLKSYQTVHSFLDNDSAVQNAYQQLAEKLSQSEVKTQVIDYSHSYKDFNDLNEYLKHSRENQEKRSQVKFKMR